MGQKVAQILEYHYKADSGHLDTLGRSDIPDGLMSSAREVRQCLATRFGAPITQTGIRAELVAALATASDDPDIEVPDWLRGTQH